MKMFIYLSFVATCLILTVCAHKIGYDEGQQDALIGKQKFQMRTNNAVEFVYR